MRGPTLVCVQSARHGAIITPKSMHDLTSALKTFNDNSDFLFNERVSSYAIIGVNVSKLPILSLTLLFYVVTM